MAGHFIQRYPFSPKAEWWKRYTDMQNTDNNANNIMKIEKNFYLRKYKFDCLKETDRKNGFNQSMNGLTTELSDLVLKTHNFCDSKDEPKHDDVLFYQGKFWLIQETRKTFMYMPKEKSILHISLKHLKIGV